MRRENLTIPLYNYVTPHKRCDTGNIGDVVILICALCSSRFLSLRSHYPPTIAFLFTFTIAVENARGTVVFYSYRMVIVVVCGNSGGNER